MKKTLNLLLFVIFANVAYPQSVEPGAYDMQKYLPELKGKRVAVVANQASLINSRSLVDSLFSLKVNLKKIFSPEHGFRGNQDAGSHVVNSTDSITGLEIVSLYGNNKKPSKADMSDLDIMVFDLQDVGVRFYTYISSLHYIMEACAENNVKLVVLDRPNPNIFYVDGPVLELENKSFVGMHQVPVVYGMTIGEYALMINGEKWLDKGIQCDLKVVKINNYTRNSRYDLPEKPSPNLPNSHSINLYPSLCFFEGTPISAGRGTQMQFQIFGAPEYRGIYPFSFTPQSNPGASNPKFKDQICYGMDLRNQGELSRINLEWLIQAYKHYPQKEKFFNGFFLKLSGTASLENQIKEGWSEQKIRESWQSKIDNFLKIRKSYLIYPQ